MGEHKFKVGDKLGHVTPWWDGKATPYKVIGLFNSYEVEDDNGRTYFWPECEFAKPAPLFAVGDSVRVVRSGEGKEGSGHEADVGDVTEITSIDKFGDEVEYTTSSGWFFYAHEIEPVAVAPQPQPLRIKAGAYYRTRDGRKVGPAEDRGSYFNLDEWDYNASGICGYEGRANEEDYRRKHDLIAEWTDEPAVPSSAPSTASFKVGDTVRVVKDGDARSCHGAHIGQTFKVERVTDELVNTKEWVFYPDEVEVVKDEQSSTTGFTVPLDAPEFGGGERFKVGDLVVGKSNIGNPIEGRVEEVDEYDDEQPYMVGGYWCYAKDLRLVAEATSGKDEEPDALARFQLCDVFEAKEMARAGIFTINEVRKKFGLPPISSGDKLAT